MDRLIQVAEDFWNIRGSFKVAGIVDIGTQASLVKQADGRFIFIDSYTLTGSVEQQVSRITNDGANIDAILNVHPFHTVHVRKMHERFPRAKLYGTARHLSRDPELPWQEACTEDPALHAMFADDFDFSIPRGVDFISANPNVHFSSVLVMHRASETIHVDDTLMYIPFPRMVRAIGLGDAVSFHPTLAKALEKRAGATLDFQQWAEGLAERWRNAENLCAAHTAALLGSKNRGASIHDRILKALDKVRGTLKSHERKYG
jgi:hypothetical protein